MIIKILHEGHFYPEELAAILNITPLELEKFLTQKSFRKKFIKKINVPLIHLYCALFK